MGKSSQAAKRMFDAVGRLKWLAKHISGARLIRTATVHDKNTIRRPTLCREPLSLSLVFSAGNGHCSCSAWPRSSGAGPLPSNFRISYPARDRYNRS